MMLSNISWSKGAHFKLSTFFETDEFNCRCTQCKEQIISSELVQKLTEVRQELGAPVIITSGYRCANKQRELKEAGYETAKGVSPHQLGMAVDLVPKNPKDFDKLVKLCDDKFPAMGVGSNWLHVDTRSDVKRRWTYRK